jgi:UDP-GlcNAc:undecaprenyl-phosphate GlcNAc-1-phosphate transferase
MLLGLFFISIFKRLVLKINKLISNGIPLVGGISIGFSFLITVLMGFSLINQLDKKIWGIIVASLFMLLSGVYDDLKAISIFNKFLLQIIATFILVIFGIRTEISGIGEVLNLLITFLWIIGITNAFNHLDIIDGLCGGVGFLVGISFLIISILNSQPNVSIITLAFLGALLSFLKYNLPPAKIYLGNCGSHFLGFVLSAQAIIISYASIERKVALLSPILLLGYPIYDTSFLILMRLKNRRPILRKSKDHLALKFLNQGYPVKRIIIYLFLLTFLFCICGILVSQLSNLLGILLIFILLSFILILTLRFLKIF